MKRRGGSGGKVGRFLFRLGTGAKSAAGGRRWRSFVPGKKKNRAPAAEDLKTAGFVGGRALRTSADGPLRKGVRPMTRPLWRGSIRAVRSAGTPRGQGAADHPPEPPLQSLRRVHVCHPEPWDRLLRNDSRIRPLVQEVPQERPTTAHHCNGGARWSSNPQAPPEAKEQWCAPPARRSRQETVTCSQRSRAFATTEGSPDHLPTGGRVRCKM